MIKRPFIPLNPKIKPISSIVKNHFFKKQVILLSFLSVAMTNAHSQFLVVSGGDTKKEIKRKTGNGYHYNNNAGTTKPTFQKRQDPATKPAKLNLVKLNLTAIALKNYSLQYERLISRKISAAVSYRYMPTATIPFKQSVIKSLGENDPETINTINKFEIGNIAITPEVRFYVGKKGFGKGFYLAPFYRYASFITNNVEVQYNEDDGSKGNVTLSGKLSGHSGGILLGAQWELGKSLCIDWWILGPHYGSSNGSLTGVTSRALSQTEQNDIKGQVNDIEIPLVKQTVTTSPNNINVNLNGPWGGVRAGISFGIRF